MLLIAATAAIACWFFFPGTAFDKAAFAAVSRCTANPPFFISGNGSHCNPWKLRTFAAQSKADRHQAPVIVSLGDDLEGFFQTSPPSPIDLAVVLTNFRRLGAHKAASGAVLAWETPDPMGLAALDKAIARFDSWVATAPLSRGPVPDQLPPAFRKASLPLAKILGDPMALPLVNRIALPGVILGGDNSVAGFQALESEPKTKFPPLLARWDDRVVFAFPLLVVLQRLDFPLDKIEVRLAQYLKLGPDGPTIPIDRYGRLTLPLKKIAPYGVIAAESLIDAGDDAFPKTAPEPVILRDDRSAAEPATRTFSSNLPAMVATLASNAGLTPERIYQRPTCSKELLYLFCVILVLCASCGLPVFPRSIVFACIATACIAAQAIAAGSLLLWLPGIPALAAVAAACVVSPMVDLTASKTIVVRVPAPSKEKPIQAKPDQALKPEKPAKAVKPGKPPKPAKSDTPPKPPKPAKAVKSAKSSHSVRPTKDNEPLTEQSPETPAPAPTARKKAPTKNARPRAKRAK